MWLYTFEGVSILAAASFPTGGRSLTSFFFFFKATHFAAISRITLTTITSGIFIMLKSEIKPEALENNPPL